jgi:hypothetical protein
MGGSFGFAPVRVADFKWNEWRASAIYAPIADNSGKNSNNFKGYRRIFGGNPLESALPNHRLKKSKRS